MRPNDALVPVPAMNRDFQALLANCLIQRLPSSRRKHTIRVLVPDWLAGGSHSKGLATLYIAHLLRQVTHSHKTFQRHSERHLWATSGKTSLMTCDRSKRLQIIRDVLPDGCRSSETSYRCLDRSGAQTHEPPSGCMQGELCLDGRS